MVKVTKDITLIGLFIALLIGGQFALSGVAGVEVITILLTCFCFYFGIRRGVILVNLFSLARCLIFGFYPSVIILYIVYYNMFAVTIGFIGNKLNRIYSIKNNIIVLVAVVILTAVFTLLDDVITPLFWGFNKDSAIAYFYSSLYVILTQEICAVISVVLLFAPIVKLFNRLHME